jgi:hypothetical protein
MFHRILLCSGKLQPRTGQALFLLVLVKDALEPVKTGAEKFGQL